MTAEPERDKETSPVEPTRDLTLPAEVLYLISDHCVRTWTDHELWFRLGHSCRVLRAAVLEHFLKDFRTQPAHVALHTRLEQHCSGRIIRDAASITRIESFLRNAVCVKSSAPCSDTRRPREPLQGTEPANGEEHMHDWEAAEQGWDGSYLYTPEFPPRIWTFQSVDSSDQCKVTFKTVCTGSNDQDLRAQQQLYPRQSHAQLAVNKLRLDQEQGAKAETLRVEGKASLKEPTQQAQQTEDLDTENDTNPERSKGTTQTTQATPFQDWTFTFKALSIETAETGKIDFEDVPIHVAWLEDSHAERMHHAHHIEPTYTLAIDWREMWAKKLGRERFCHKKQMLKQKEVEEKIKAARAATAAALARGRVHATSALNNNGADKTKANALQTSEQADALPHAMAGGMAIS